MPAFALIAALLVTRQQSSDNYSQTWESVSRAISEHYYARKTRRDEMNRLLAKYKPISSAARSRPEFDREVNDMITEFKDSHFALFTTDDQGFFTMDALIHRDDAAKFPNIGAYFSHGPQGYTVQMVLDGSSAQKAGLRKGDVIQMAGGAAFRPVRSFSQGGIVDLTVLRSGQVLHKSVSTENENAEAMFLKGTQASVRIIPDNGRKIGYMHLWTLSCEEEKQALANAVYGKLVDTDAFILDLRDGFGGRPEGYADPFFRPEMSIDWNSVDGDTHEQFGYQRPLIVLINGGSRSAKEVLSLILKKCHRATLVGSRSAGNVLGTSPLRINNWAYLEIPMVEVVTDGMKLEGHGVEPDIAVPSEFDADGRDLYLAKALELLRDVKVRV